MEWPKIQDYNVKNEHDLMIKRHEIHSPSYDPYKVDAFRLHNQTVRSADETELLRLICLGLNDTFRLQYSIRDWLNSQNVNQHYILEYHRLQAMQNEQLSKQLRYALIGLAFMIFLNTIVLWSLI